MRTKHLSSLGHLATLLQAPVSEIEAALQRRRVAPVFTLNGVTYYDVSKITTKAKPKARADRRRGKSRKQEATQ